LKQARRRPRDDLGAKAATAARLMDASNLHGPPSRRSGSGRSAKDIPVDDAKMRTFIADMYAAMSLLRLLRQEIASTLSLSSAEYSVLLAVRYLERGSDMTLRAIADHLHVAAAYVTAEVGRLVDKGLLTKRPDPLDRRAVAVELTAASRELLSRLGPMLRDINDPLLAGISSHDLDTVHRFFRGVISHGYEAISVARGFGIRD
jgi:MarR family transcriptional regulator, organic hydroperoxide resistance regulator